MQSPYKTLKQGLGHSTDPRTLAMPDKMRRTMLCACTCMLGAIMPLFTVAEDLNFLVMADWGSVCACACA